jgi:putative transposase
MLPRRPLRLPEFDYLGCYQYFVTCCTVQCRQIFVTGEVVTPLALQILHTCRARDFEVLAYVFMPDHLHLLIEGQSKGADFRALMRVLRQRTTIQYRGQHRAALWQDGYFERVLRDSTHSKTVVEYLLANPVRAGLVECATEYAFGRSPAAGGT